MFGAVDKLLSAENINLSEIGLVVTNCSVFCPTPSLAAMVINHYKLQATAYALGGQGCGIGPAAVDLVHAQLRLHKNIKYALLVSTENMTQSFYAGDDRSMLLPNALFRMGGSAVLFSLQKKGKYELKTLVKTHIGAVDGAYRCVY